MAASMEKQGHPQPLVLQPVMASAPPMPPAGEATHYYSGPPEEPHSVYHMTADSAPPPYHSIHQTQPAAMHGYGTPLLHQPTAGYQGRVPLYHQSAHFCWVNPLACLGN